MKKIMARLLNYKFSKICTGGGTYSDADCNIIQKIMKLIKPFLEENADVVYGSRFTGSFLRRVIYYKNHC